MMRVAIVLFGTVLLGATHSDAATIDNDRPGGTADYVRVKTVARDQDDKIVVTLEIDAGYHINANPATFDYLIPTTLNVTNLPPLRVSYPAPVRFKPKFVDEALNVYEGTVRITAEFAHGALSRNPYLFGTVTAQACTDVICLPPADLPLPHQ